ncbi:MAG: hypothetical protein CVU38_16880 [Chloroflexi bacterium HGW-Chloroflexi-1]|nr:MAG: hypothetical protein CVU38_16880 [Chloroflexi bacterium HGW-Chloroflexi-1]
MRVIDLALKDLSQIVRDRKSFIFLAIMPIAFTLFFGLIFGGSGGPGEGDTRLPVGFADLDGGGSLSANLQNLLMASEAVRPEVLAPDRGPEAGDLVREGKLAAVVIVPAGFTAGTLAGESPRLAVIVDQSAPAGMTARNEIQAAALRLLGTVEAARLSAGVMADRRPFANDAARRAYLDEALTMGGAAWRQPPLSVTVETAGGLAESEPNAFTQSSPGMLVQFAIYGLILSAMTVVLERKSRAMQRLLTTPVTRAQIVAGHVLAMFLVVFFQEVLLVALGQFALGVDYLRAPVATLLVVVALGLWTASLGLLIGAISKNEDQVIMWSLLAMFVFSAMGGAWFPLEITGRAFSAIGHLMPSAWAMDGFLNIVARGLGLTSVLLPTGVLLAYAGIFFGLAVWRFKFE